MKIFKGDIMKVAGQIIIAFGLFILVEIIFSVLYKTIIVDNISFESAFGTVFYTSIAIISLVLFFLAIIKSLANSRKDRN